MSDSFTIRKKMKQRFQDRQTRSKKEVGKIQKHWAGYSSGRYAGSSIGHPQLSLEEMELRGPQMNPHILHPKSHDTGDFGTGEPVSGEETDED